MRYTQFEALKPLEVFCKYIFQLNPQYEAIFDARNIDEDCDKIADEINDVARMQIKEILAVGMFKQAVRLYLQLLQSMVNHFVDDEHFYYFDDMYSLEYSLQRIYEVAQTSALSHQPSFSNMGRVNFVQDNESMFRYGVMWGLQVKEYLIYVWREVMSGNTDYESMTPEMVIAKRNS